MVGAALALAVISMLSNINTAAQMAGDADVLRAARLTVSRLVNSGVVWAGLMVLAGWLVKPPRQAAAAGVAAGLASLAAHHAMGQAIGMFRQPDILPWPDQFSSALCGVLLLLGGIVGVAWAILTVVRKRSALREAPREFGAGIEGRPLVDQPVRADQGYAVG